MSAALDKIIATKRLPTLFIGSGLSKRYLQDFLSWSQLLDTLREKIGISASAFAAKRHEIKSREPDITDGKLNQLMASFLQSKLLSKIESDEIDVKTLFTDEENEQCINHGVDYFKMLVAKQFATYSLLDDKEDELKLLKRIGPKTSMVFTTNYDQFLEKEVFPNSKVYDRQDKYYFRTNSGYGELYKVHGSVTDPNGIVFCESDYAKFDNSLKLVSSKLINALLDFPVIFLGYSLEDENIKKIMADFVNSFGGDVLDDIKKYMIMVVYEEGQKDLIEGEKQFVDAASGRTITLTTIKTDNFAAIYEAIDQLSPFATAYELRKYRNMVVDIINQEAKGVKKVFAQSIDDVPDGEIALYIGKKSDIQSMEKSLDILTNEDIIERVLKRVNLNYDGIAKTWYDSKGISAPMYTPVFAIKHFMSVTLEDCCQKFKNNYYKKLKYYQDISLSDSNAYNYDVLCEKIAEIKKGNLSSKYASIARICIPSLHFGKITEKQLESILKHLLQDDPKATKDSAFKNMACYMWYRMYEK